VGLGVSFELPPGPRVAGIPTGDPRIGVSPRSGPLTVPGTVGPASPQASVSHAVRVNLAQLARQARTAAKAQDREGVAAAERALTSLHLNTFPPACPVRIDIPARPGDAEVSTLAAQLRSERLRGVSIFDRTQRRQLSAACDAEATNEMLRRHLGGVIRAQLEQAEADERWAGLLRHDTALVIAEIDAAFVDNESTSTCVDAGVDAATGELYAACVVMFGTAQMVPEQVAVLTPGAEPTLHKRTMTDRNTVYLTALASTVLATAKEALATSPATTEVRVLTLRHDPTAPVPEDGLVPIYVGRFPRSWMEALDWARIDPVQTVQGAPWARLALQGVTHEVVPIPLEDDTPAQHLIRSLLDEMSRNLTGTPC
jgi:hypothetical protein